MSFDYDLPHGWSWKTIEEVQESPKGATITGPFGSSIGKKFFVEKGVPVIRGNNLSLDMIPFIDNGFVYVSEEKAEELKRYKSIADDLLFTAAGTIGQVGIIPKKSKYEEYIISNKQLRARLNTTIVDPTYAYYWFSSKPMVEYIKRQNTGSTIPLINLGVLRSLPLPVPSLDVQFKVRNILGSFDKKIWLNRQTNQTLEEMAQAIFKSWFVDFDPVKAKMNGEQPEGMDAATASLFPEKLVESELGLIPEGWEASKLENLVDIASSKRVFAKEYLEEGVPFYRGKEITELSKGNSITPEIYISEERYQELKDKAGAPKEGDILITSVGTIGNTYLVDSDDKFYFKDGNLTWVKDYKDEEIPYFLMEWFKSAVGKCAIENIKIGSTQQAITIKSLNGIKLVNPSNDIHKNFTNLIAPLYQKHRANIKQSKALANLRDTLLPKLLSGEIELGATEEMESEV